MQAPVRTLAELLRWPMILTACTALSLVAPAQGPSRPRARELGVVVGTLPTGKLNAITDVGGVRVGHVTLRDNVRFATGLTVVLPPGENIFAEKAPAAIEVFNGFGKLVGYTQVRELGEIETPIALTSTLNVHRVADGIVDYILGLPGNEQIRSLNAVVGETNDGRLNDIQARPVQPWHVLEAIRAATDGAVAEGSVGAGTGTVCFGYKGGIGTSSRRTPDGRTVGVLVQTNFGGDLHILGLPVGRWLRSRRTDSGDGSLMIVIATDAPLNARNLGRLARRAFLGMARTGGNGSNGSGDYAIAFSTAGADEFRLSNNEMTPLFEAVAEATEEAIYNSLFAAETVKANGQVVEALPITRVRELLEAQEELLRERNLIP